MGDVQHGTPGQQTAGDAAEQEQKRRIACDYPGTAHFILCCEFY